MKRIFLLIMSIGLFIMGGCSFFVTEENSTSHSFSNEKNETEKIEFISSNYLNEEFITFLKRQTPESLPEDSKEIFFEDQHNDIQVFIVNPANFEDFEGNFTIFDENLFQNIHKMDFFGGKSYNSLFQFSFIFEKGEPRVFYSYNNIEIKFFKQQDQSDFFFKLGYDYITADGNRETTLYKNFRPVKSLEARENPYIWEYLEFEPTIVEWEDISDWEQDVSGNIYILIEKQKQPLGDVNRRSSVLYYIERNGEILENPVSNKTSMKIDLNGAGENIVYSVYSSDDEFSSYTYSVVSGDEVIYSKEIGKTGDWLTTSDLEPYDYVYGAKLTESGAVVTFMNAYQGLLDKEPDITDTKVTSIIKQQKQFIEQFYLLLDQQNFEKAYALLNDPKQSFEEFVQKWENYKLIDIEYIFSKTIAFACFNAEDCKIEKTSNENVFKVQLFLQDDEGDIWEQGEFFHVKDMQYIEYLPQERNWKRKVDYSNPDFGDNMKKTDTLKLYFHLINRKKFEEAHKLQASANPSVAKLEEMYGNVEKVDIMYAGICQLKLDNNFAEMNHDTYEKDFYDSVFRTLVNVVDHEGTTTYYGNRKVVNGKIQTLSTQKVNYDFSQFNSKIFCGDGLGKPVIYLYPEQEMKINVHLPLQGQFTVTYPQISENNTREVIAQPDGTLENKADGKEYSYLFWEGIGKDKFDIKQGFVVKKEDTIKFLQEKLAFLGLTPREYNEFIVYRRPLMMKNERNLISFIGEEYTNQAPLFISPKPDSMQRVFMVFKGLDEPIEIQEQILQPFERSGFSVIERGGSEIF